MWVLDYVTFVCHASCVQTKTQQRLLFLSTHFVEFERKDKVANNNGMAATTSKITIVRPAMTLTLRSMLSNVAMALRTTTIPLAAPLCPHCGQYIRSRLYLL